MTRKDYEKIARMLANLSVVTVSNVALVHRQTLIDRMADIMAADNPRFNRDRFLTACDRDTV
jgi:hypothetical protein